MGFTLAQVEGMAPDQASLKAAAGLSKPAKWATLSHEADLWWGECQGSGANPYRTVVDAAKVGYKCTCPSRKLPCKHAIALMWLTVGHASSFVAGTTPQWVTDWMGRRRDVTPREAAGPGAGKSIATATQAAEAATARGQAGALKRTRTNRAAIADGLDDLDQWISDQIGAGLLAFVDGAATRCRRIAARLVDNQAAGLASRIDEIPSRLLALPAQERPDAAIRELGKLVLLARAWRANPDDPQAARDVGTAERRADILDDAGATRLSGRWEVVGEQIRARRDGLVSQSTWFLGVGVAEARFALLLDYYPATAGRRESSFTLGAQYDATMAFYKAPVPLRAVAQDLAPTPPAQSAPWPPSPLGDPLRAVRLFADAVPWQLEFPLLLPPGRVVKSHDQPWFWDGAAGLPLDTLPQRLMPQVGGVGLAQSVGVWDGARLSLLSARTPLGKVGLT